ncbi:MAG: MarR family transcriptional regulator [Acholeplasma sp.]|nr:MarR family transcriptional regulator [Acholeplasma sp.]
MRNLKTVTVLFRAKNSFENIIKKDVLSYGLNPSEFGTLEALYHKGNLSVQEVTEKVLIANSSMTYVLDNLVKRGLITREQSLKDKRSFVLSLTQNGIDKMNQIYPTHEINMKKVLAVLTAEEELELQRLLKKIGKAASACTCK